MPEDDFDIYGEDEGFNSSTNVQVGTYFPMYLKDELG
jgi:hypothetical protein